MDSPDSPITEGILGNEQAQRTMINRDRLRQQQEAQDWLAIMQQEQGRRVIRTILSYCHIHEPSLVANNAVLTAMREGERNVGLKILYSCEATAPECWKEMMMTELQTAVDAARLVKLADDGEEN